MAITPAGPAFGCSNLIQSNWWESRFKSYPLDTEEAVLSCMAYVDLNPIWAAIADTPETSAHTSIKERTHPQFNLTDAVQNQIEQQALNNFCVPLKPLLGFEGVIRNGFQRGILFGFEEPRSARNRGVPVHAFLLEETRNQLLATQPARPRMALPGEG